MMPARFRFCPASILAPGLWAGILALVPAAALAAPPILPLTLPLPAPLPPVKGLTVLVGLHVLGVCFGLGGATMLDFWILRWLRWGGLPGEIARIFGYVSKVCTVGLILLWLSGLGFLALYAVESPEKLGNPKLWAKVTVVMVLTLNGLVIHGAVLPGVLRDVSRPMFQGMPAVRTGVFLASGAVSGVSWYTAFALGVMRELNGAVAYGLLIALWLSAILAAFLGSLVLLRFTRRAGELPQAGPALAAERPGPRIPPGQIVRIGANPARP